MTNTLYLPLTKKECLTGWVVAVLYIGLCLLLGAQNYLLMCLVAVAAAVALLLLLREFTKETIFNLSILGKRVWLRPVFAVCINSVICTVFNDLLLMYQVPYFVASDWGPMLWDIRAAVIAGHGSLFWVVAAIVVLVMPIVEELIFRQLIFSTLHPISSGLAIAVSVCLFSAFHVLPFAPMMEDAIYLFAYAFQFIPMGFLLCWLYKSTDSIVSPILMHILRNALLISTALRYMS